MKSRKIIDSTEIEKIIQDSEICTIGMVDEDNMPYTLPFSFGYGNETVYLHSAPEGRKTGILKNNPNVCISFSTAHQLHRQSGDVACSYSMRYKSVLLKGKVEFVSDYDAKVLALNLIMKHYTGKDDFTYNAPSVNNVVIMKIKAVSVEGKAFGY